MKVKTAKSNNLIPHKNNFNWEMNYRNSKEPFKLN